MADIEQELQKRILVLDGAMGTAIQQYPLEEDDFRKERFKDHPDSLKGNNDLLTLTRPDVIKEIHRNYFEVGTDIAETNTFSSTRIAQADYNTHDEETVYNLNYEAAQLAREVADEFTEKEPEKPRFVTGVMGPTNKTGSLSPDVNDPGYRAITFDELKNAYKEQAVGLMDGGVDLFLIETIFDTLNAKAALFGLEELFDERGEKKPVMVSGTITDASGRTLSGQTAEAFLASVMHGPLLSIGLNCALGAKELKPYLQRLSKNAPFFISAHPNAGLPNEFGEYDETPEQMKEQIKEYMDDNLINIIGGCCGTTPDHLKAIAELAANYKPRTVEDKKPFATASAET